MIISLPYVGMPWLLNSTYAVPVPKVVESQDIKVAAWIFSVSCIPPNQVYCSDLKSSFSQRLYQLSQLLGLQVGIRSRWA